MSTDGQYFVAVTEPAAQALWRMHSLPEKTIFTVSDSGKVAGFITAETSPPWSPRNSALAAGDIMRTDVHTVNQKGRAAEYMAARNIIAQYPSVKLIPVINDYGEPVKVLRKWQLFFKSEYFRCIRTCDPIELPYPPYAVAIWRAAEIASATGFSEISVLEFGVANGEGLRACALLAQETGAIFNIKIHVFGFDGCAGLPESRGYKDCPQCWDPGMFRMRHEEPEAGFYGATLLPGDFEDSIPAFIQAQRPPVGAIMLDVDFYSSAIVALGIFNHPPCRFLPIVSLYADDIGASLEFQGETLAIKEFNQKSALRKISPELESFGEFNFHGRRYGFSKLKSCHMFDHPLYNCNGFQKKVMHDFWR